VYKRQVQAEDGHFDEAAESCATILRMSRHVQESPTIIGQLVGYAMSRYAVGALEHVLSEGDPTAATCQGLFDEMAEMDQTAASMRGMQGEVAFFGRPLFDGLRRGTVIGGDLVALAGPTSRARSSMRGSWRVAQGIGRPLINLDEITYLGVMEAYIEGLGMFWPESKQRLEAMDSQMGHQRFPPAVLTRMIMPVFLRFGWSRDESIARLGAAQIALALTAYAGENGRYPDSLTELEAGGWELPVDPFSQEPFHCRRDGEGFIVWSVGPDMDDDDGRPLDRSAVNDLARTQEMSEEELRKARDDYDLPVRWER